MRLEREDQKEIIAVADRYNLSLPRTPLGGRVGELMGTGTGSSVEFQDFREYLPGDDLRHINWAAYGRTDKLTVRLFREEVRPMIDVIIDNSRSMAVRYPEDEEQSKETRARQIGTLMARLGLSEGAGPVLWIGGDQRIPLNSGADIDDPLARVDFDDVRPLDDRLPLMRGALRRNSLRYVISDFLFPHDPNRFAGALAEGAAGLAFIQLVSPVEQSPPEMGPVRLVDVETEQYSDIIAGRTAVERYKERFRRLQYGIYRATRRARASYALLTCDTALEYMCRKPLCDAGILVPGQ